MKTNEGSAILALDGGFTATGWAVLRNGLVIAAGCIRTERSAKKKTLRVADDDAARCQHLARTLAGIIEEHSIAGIVAELPSGGAKGARANRCMGLATGTLAAVVEQSRLPAEWLTPGDVKKTVTGARAASKKAVEAEVLKRWPDAPLPELRCEREHAVDAAASFLAAEHGTVVRLLTGA